MTDVTIVIVDDEIELRENLQDLLEFKGYNVIAFSNGEEILEEIDALATDLILLDYQLPAMNGLEVLYRIKKKKPDLKVVLVTASSLPSITEKADEYGAERIIFKPYSQMEMLQAVEEMLRKEET